MREYIISVPLMNDMSIDEKTRKIYVNELRRIGAKRVFLCLPRASGCTEAMNNTITLLKENIEYYRNEGFEIGAWTSSCGHGGMLCHETDTTKLGYTLITGFSGNSNEDTYCPSDEDFTRLMTGYIEMIAGCSPDIIMLDDDFRLSWRSCGMGCTCDKHLKMFAEISGINVKRNELYDLIFSGGPSNIRTQWLDLMKKTMLDFAKSMRKAVDSVDPSIRLGYCAAPASWDSEGTDVAELTYAFAGNTKPFVRTIGAAYWGSNGYRMAQVADMERTELGWLEKYPDIEVFTEGDVYPRLRYRVPCWVLEAFDSILRADGRTDGILKYVFDYTYDPLYETSYTDTHVHNAPMYKAIEDNFKGKQLGVYVYEEEHKLRNAVFEGSANAGVISNYSVATASQLLSLNSIPMSSEYCGVTLIVDENARNIPLTLLNQGSILDAKSAMILSKRGIDVGFSSYEYTLVPSHEEYTDLKDYQKNRMPVCNGKYVKFMLLQNAEVLSWFVNDNERFPAVWYYKNDAGQKFMVYAFEFLYSDILSNSIFDSHMIRTYCRQAQLVNCLKRLGNDAIPAVCMKEPELYIMVKEDNTTGKRTVGLWNLSPDKIIMPEILLNRKFTKVTFIYGATGELCNDVVKFASDIPSHEFAAFAVE